MRGEGSRSEGRRGPIRLPPKAEKAAFESLIFSKAHMSLPAEDAQAQPRSPGDAWAT